MSEVQPESPEVPKPAANKMADLRTRVISAVVIVPVVLFLIYVGGWYFATMLLVLGVLMLREWHRITGVTWKDRVFIVNVAILLEAGLLAKMDMPLLAVLSVVSGAAVVYWLTERFDKDQPWPTLGLIYVAMPTISLIWLGDFDLPADGYVGQKFVLWLILVIGATDTCAYFSGRAIGGPKLAPKLSPSKTWAGLFGGMLGAGVMGVIAGLIMSLPVSFWSLAPMGAVLAVVAQAGDIGESSVKRRFGVKDSGSLIPGHGGVLDRVDGFVATAPLLALGVLWAL